MLFKLEKLFLSAFLLSASPAFGITVAGVSPYGISSGNIYYAVSGITSGFIDSKAGFKTLDQTVGVYTGESSTTHLVQLKITVATNPNTDTSETRMMLAVYTEDDSGGDIKGAIGAVNGTLCSSAAECTSSDTLNGRTYHHTALISNFENEVTLGIFVKDICGYAEDAGANDPVGCTNQNVDAVSDTAAQKVKVTVLMREYDASLEVTPGNAKETSDIAINLQTDSADPTNCTDAMKGFYFPGDGEIIVNTNALTAESPGTNESSATNILTIARQGGTGTITGDNYDDFPIYNRSGLASGGMTIGGFANTTDGSNNGYGMAVTTINGAGIVSAFQSGCQFSNVRTSAIGGFLKEGNCFIATAAFQSPHHPLVKVLRQFRDQILLRFEPGKALVDSYYTHSPQAAFWLMSHSHLRLPVMALLIPIACLAWLILHPLLLAALFSAFFVARWTFRR